jgi:hypothetical protein
LNLAYLKNRLVHFRVCDVYIPDPPEVLNELYGNDILQGKVVDLTDSGEREKAFVVVKVEGVKNLLIIPAEKIIGIESVE